MRMILRTPITFLLATLAMSSLAPTLTAQSEAPVLGPRYAAPSYAVPNYATQAVAIAKPAPVALDSVDVPVGQSFSAASSGQVLPAYSPYELNAPSVQMPSSVAPAFTWQEFAETPVRLAAQNEAPSPVADDVKPERHGPITSPGEPLPAASADRLPSPGIVTPQPSPPFPAQQQLETVSPAIETVGPPATSTTTRRTSSPSRQSLLNFRRFRNRTSPRRPLASVPPMFGDFLEPAIRLDGVNGAQRIQADVPLGGGGRRLKMSENNSALPTSRVILAYNRFNNALDFDSDTATAGGARSSDVNRFTFGFEMADQSESWSLEARFTVAEHYAGSGDQFSLQGSGIGNAMIGLKRILYVQDGFALTGGLGFDFGTGGDIDLNIGAHRLVVRNEAVHAMPYLATVFERGPFFFQGFSQGDFALSGNSVEAFDTCPCATVSTGQYTEQNFWHNDLSAGVWLLTEDSNLCWIKGLAVLAEYHYTTTLNDSDSISRTFSLGESFTLSNPANRVNPRNVTFGIHALLHSNMEVRLGVAIPVSDGDDRWFDSEWMLQINHRL